MKDAKAKGLDVPSFYFYEMKEAEAMQLDASEDVGMTKY
jgi:hypothetical protein